MVDHACSPPLPAPAKSSQPGPSKSRSTAPGRTLGKTKPLHLQPPATPSCHCNPFFFSRRRPSLCQCLKLSCCGFAVQLVLRCPCVPTALPAPFIHRAICARALDREPGTGQAGADLTAGASESQRLRNRHEHAVCPQGTTNQAKLAPSAVHLL